MIILISESTMNDKLIDIIEEQNNNYLGIVALVVTLALAIFGIIQWQINSKKLHQLKEQAMRESEEKIVKKYDLDQIELLKNKFSQLDSIEAKLSNSIANELFFTVEELVSSDNLSKDNIASKLLAYLSQLKFVAGKTVDSNFFIKAFSTFILKATTKIYEGNSNYLDKEIIGTIKDIIKILKMDAFWIQVKDYELIKEDLIKVESDFLKALKRTNNDK